MHNLLFTSVLPKLPYIHRQSIAFMIAGGDMVRDDWESMTIDELFVLREEMAAILMAKLIARKKLAKDRLVTLNHPVELDGGKS